MKRAVAATTATVAGLFLMLALKPHQSPPPAAAPPAGLAPSASPSGVPSGAPSGAPSAPERDGTSGTFTGDTIDTRRGPVQVRVTLVKGRLTAVTVLKGEHDEGPSADAVPRLTQEALAAQNAKIDAVSGATFTSQGYISSLQSALDRARG
ncbi:FMN-binding protein [Streptomyces sp. NPDC048637]|uniref:FMN-binding protein n=1 Tax=Streptomyces sp. NPDC048637 TaxID=3155636 RepID=UPI0034170CC4